MASPTWGLGSLTGISWVPPLSRYCEELGTALLVGAGGRSGGVFPEPL